MNWYRYEKQELYDKQILFNFRIVLDCRGLCGNYLDITAFNGLATWREKNAFECNSKQDRGKMKDKGDEIK